MSERYEMWTPAQAVDRLAADLPGGRADAEQVVASYLRDATGVHGRPSSGWRLDEFDLDDARARFGWVDFAGGETVAQARTRADAAAVAALRDARGTSAITERDRLAGLHSDAEMWGYRAHQVGLDELTNTSACDPKPRWVTVGREGRERSHREATAAHDARVAAVETAAEVAALAGSELPEDNSDPQHDADSRDHEEDPVNARDHGNDTSRDPREQVKNDCRQDKHGQDETNAELRDIESVINAEHWTHVIDAVAAENRAGQDPTDGHRAVELSDSARNADIESSGSAGGLWLALDPAGGEARPLTGTEMRRVADLVRETQADALSGSFDDDPPVDRGRPVCDEDATGWAR